MSLGTGLAFRRMQPIFNKALNLRETRTLKRVRTFFDAGVLVNLG